jgi:titin
MKALFRFPLWGVLFVITGCYNPSNSDNPQPPEAPASLSVTAADKQLTVSWTAVEGATAYEVWYGTSSDSANAQQFGDDVPSTRSRTSSSGVELVETTITGLTNGTTYYVWVKAKNSAGTSGFSPARSGMPAAATTAPAAPGLPTITTGDKQITVSWTAVNSATAYEVWYGTSSDSANARKFGDDVTSTNTTITGLTNGTIYYMWVKAKNKAGASGFSPSASGTPAAGPRVTPGDRQLTVSWTAVEGAAAYELWYGTSDNAASAQQFGSEVTQHSVIITGLTNGTLYYVWVKVKNSAGTSGFGPSSSGTPRPDTETSPPTTTTPPETTTPPTIETPPPAATGPTAPSAPTVTPADSLLTVSWTAVPDATAYEVWYGTSSSSGNAAKLGSDVTNGTSETITGLTNGTTYYVWIKAKNSGGISGFSPSASGTPAAATVPPDTPSAPAVTAGNAQVSVSWTAVPGATAYEVYWHTADNTAAIPSANKKDAPNGTSETITGLTNGTTYYVWVKAKNSVGTSDFSPSASGRPAAVTYKPAAPFMPAVTAGNAQVSISWTAVEGATAYEVWYGTSSDSANAQQFVPDLTNPTATIPGLTNGTLYHVWVKAKNSVGTSGFSPSASGTPTAAVTYKPAAPFMPAVTAGNVQVSVSWTAVEGATAYEVYWHTENNSSAIPSANKQDVPNPTATIPGLTNGTTYYVWIKAKNSVGTSGFSPSASGTPAAVTSAPAAPFTPTITAADSELTVSWTAVIDATAYEVWYGTSSSSGSAQKYGGDVGSTSATIPGLTNGTTYYVWVKAKNSVGTSGFSPSASGTPVAATAPPAAPTVPAVSPGAQKLIVSWTAVPGATAYEVWYGTSNSSGSATKFGSDVTSGVNETITGLTNGTLYYVWVKAQNSFGTSGFSPSASGTPGTQQVNVGFENGNISMTNGGTSVSGFTLSRSGTAISTPPSTITLNAESGLTSVIWYVDDNHRVVGSTITLSAADWAIKRHQITLTGWKSGTYLSSAPILFTVTN